MSIAPLDEDLFGQGAACHRSGDLAAARQIFLSLVRQEPGVLRSSLALASVCLDMGDAPAAVEVLQAIAARGADESVLWHALAVAEEAAGDLDGAFAHYAVALQKEPDFFEALLDRTAFLLKRKEVGAALCDAKRLVALRPFSYQAQFNLGEAHTANWAMQEACRAYARALRLQPDSARIRLHYGFALACAGRYVEAQDYLDQAWSLDSSLLRNYRLGVFGVQGQCRDGLEAQALHLLADYERIEAADWSRRQELITRFVAQTAQLDESALAFRALALGLPGDAQLQLSRRIAAAVVREAGGLSFLRENGVRREIGERIRLGYLSPDFRHHPTSLLLGAMLARHDRRRFEIVAYDLSSDDGSEARRLVLAGADRVVDLNGVDDDTAARRISADGVDLLLDLGGYNDHARPGILARRPAPVQISWLSFMASTGAPWIDYVIADRVALPECARAHFSEACLRLPASFFPCDYAASPIQVGVRATYGLPAGKRLLAALHAPYKIDPEVFSVWLDLLRSHSDCMLLLISSRPEVQQRIATLAELAGIEASRLCFLPRLPHAEHLARLTCCDIALDTPQCNGGTSTADALAAGVPVLTLAGTTLAQRMAASLLCAAGQEAMVACSMAEYQAMAQHLLSDPARLLAQRESLAAARQSAPFFTPQRWLANFEAGLAAVWARHCAGLPPADLDVAA